MSGYALPGEIKATDCPWCGGRLRRSTADVVTPARWRRNDVEVVECDDCEFVAEPVFRNGTLVDADRREVFVFKAKDVL